MTPWSVSPSAGWSNAAARSARASIRQAPSRTEYSEWTWRCANDGWDTGRLTIRLGSDPKRGRRGRSRRYLRSYPSWPVATTQTDRELERWGDDPKLVELLGDRGAEGFRAMFDGYPDLVGVVWPVRDEDGRIVDFSFGYGNPSMMRGFRVPADISERYTLLEALPRMRDSDAFDAYVRTCESGEPWVEEITYDTPFGDGYMLGTYILR